MLTAWAKEQKGKGQGRHETGNGYVKKPRLRIPTELLHRQSKKRKNNNNNVIVLDN